MSATQLVWRRHFERQGRAAAVALEHVGRCAVLRLQRPALDPETVGLLQRDLDARGAQHAVSSVAIRCAERALVGSDLHALHAAEPAGRATHFQAVANLCRTLGESPVPVTAMLDGNLSGSALGLAAHSRFCVVTDRTRLTLPGAEFGCVPESFASHQLARLPGGVGAYLALTGAALSGAELLQLGLATHLTEAHAFERMEDELGMQASRGVERTAAVLADTCLVPPSDPGGPECALHFAREIEECFGGLGGGGRSLRETLASLEAGGTEWHAQALERVRASSPLALQLSLALLERAAASECWTRSLRIEAAVSATALGAPDCAAGLGGLGELKAALVREAAGLEASDGLGDDDAEEAGADEAGLEAGAVPRWEHDAVDAAADAVAPYFETAQQP